MRPSILSILFLIVSSLGVAAPIQYLTISSTRDFLVSSLDEVSGKQDWNTLSNKQLIQSFVQYLNSQKDKSIFVTDLDETLLTSKYFFGSTEWFKIIAPDVRAKIVAENPVADSDMVEKILDQTFWKYVKSHPEMTSADELYTELLKVLHQNGHEVFALTARHENMRDTTKAQLRSIGVDFLADQVIYSPHNSDWSSNKGKTLRSAIETRLTRFSPSGNFFRLYFFDDMTKEIDAVTDAFSSVPKVGNVKEVKIVHSQVSISNKQRSVLRRLFSTIGKFQEAAFELFGLRVSNQEAGELSGVIAPSKYMCFKFYQP